MRCIVTGGLGFIGSNLTDKLIELGHEVCVVDNLYSGKKEYLNPKAKWANADIRNDIRGAVTYKYHNEASVNTSVSFDVVFHLAAQARIQPSFQLPIKTTCVNVIGTMEALELAKKTGARLVYAGSSSFYGDPHKNPYALSKWMGEEMCLMYNQVYNVPVAIARFFNVYGPRQPSEGQYATVIGVFERQAKKKEELTITGNGEQRRDFTHVADIVEGLIAMAKDPWKGEIFNLGSGVNYSINEVSAMFQSAYKYIPARPGEAWETLADISFTKEKLGWEPKYVLTDYVQAIRSVNFLSNSSSASQSLLASTSQELPNK